MANLSAPNSDDQRDALTAAVYADLVDALRGRRLTCAQADTLRAIVVSLHSALGLLDAAEVRYAEQPAILNAYTAGVGLSVVDTFRSELRGLLELAAPTAPQS